jgi:hypothetical protein
MRRAHLFLLTLFPLLLTWPLVMRLTTHLPLGSESSATVPYFNLWTLGWNAQSLLRGFADYWQAPIFFPAPGAFAFSDPQPLIALPGALFWSLSPALAYNLTLLGYMVLNGWFAHRLLTHRETSPHLALLGALLIQALPFLTHERGVLQLQPLFGPLWALDAAWSLTARPTRKAALQLALAVLATFLTSQYYALALIPPLLLLAAIRARALLQPRSLTYFAAAAAVALALILPLALPQNAALKAMRFRRSARTLENTSALPADYLRPSSRLRLEGLFNWPGGGSGQRLYPGIVLSALALLGLAAALRDETRRPWAFFLLGLILSGYFLSLGTNLEIFGQRPLLELHQRIPFLRYTRSPFRFAMLAQMGLALASVLAIPPLAKPLGKGAYALGLLALLELLPAAEPLAALPPADPIYRAMGGAAQGAVALHIPWAPGKKAADFEPTVTWMLQSMQPGLRLVNGYSGFFPAHNSQLRRLLEAFPNPAGIAALQAMGVDWVIVHNKGLGKDETLWRQWEAQWPLRLRASSTESVAFSLMGAQYTPLETFDGQFALRYREIDGRGRLEALPIVEGSGFYIHVSGASFPWRVRIMGAAHPIALQPDPPNVLLFYHGSSAWLVLAEDLDLDAGTYQALLERAQGGAWVGELEFQVPSD